MADPHLEARVTRLEHDVTHLFEHRHTSESKASANTMAINLVYADTQAIRQEMATKADLQAVRDDMATKADLQAVRGEIAEARDELKADITGLATRLDTVLERLPPAAS